MWLAIFAVQIRPYSNLVVPHALHITLFTMHQLTVLRPSHEFVVTLGSVSYRHDIPARAIPWTLV